MRLLVAGILIAFAVAGCRDTESGTTAGVPPVKVKVVRLEAVRGAAIENVPGTVKSKLRAGMEAKIPGRIIRVPVSEGQAVKDGELLVQLDVKEIQARLDQAVAVKDQAERDLQRFTTLLQQKAATKSEYDAIHAKALVARAGVEEAKTLLGYSEIRAPFAGIITRKSVDVGDLAAPGRSLVEMEDLSALRFETNVPQTLINQVEIGSVLDVRIPELNSPLKGAVSELSPAADPNSRTFSVKLDLPRNISLRPGQFGHVLVPGGPEVVLRVPHTAVIRRGQMEMVYAVEGGRAWLRLIRSGGVSGDQVEVLAGLDPGELIVADDPGSLKDGQSVEAVE